MDIKCTHFIYLADIHFGKYNNSEEWQGIMRDYFFKWFIPKVDSYFSHKPDAKPAIMVLGDVYDDRKSIDIDVENLALDVFEELANHYPVYIINGNHDLSKRTNQGNTSLRSLNLVDGVTLIQDPLYITAKKANKKLATIVAIPYLGNYDNETRCLADASGKADYALMHTELTHLKMDNGMMITSGNNPDMFKGRIFSGHIHKRQEHKNVVYVGSPYQLTRMDGGDTKGVYIHDLETGKTDFIENNFSPRFVSIGIDDLLAMEEYSRGKYLGNNFVDVVIEDHRLNEIKSEVNIYALGDGTDARRVTPSMRKTKEKVEVGEVKYRELPISALIKDTINAMADIDDDAKARICSMSDKYIAEAEEKQGKF